MTRTTIMLPRNLRNRAARRARESGVSMGELIRQSLEQALRSPTSMRRGILDLGVYDGPAPADVSSRVDDYLYGDER